MSRENRRVQDGTAGAAQQKSTAGRKRKALEYEATVEIVNYVT
jgi:hypothetical protein